jgi:hypothetical protein
MSTERQEYSIANQLAAIKDYAQLHDFQIVRTYADEAKSGIDLAHRPALKQLLDDVSAHASDHPPVLLDVARCRVLKTGDLRWEIRYPLAGVTDLRCITLRLQADNKTPLDYLLIRSLPPGNQRYRFSEERIQRLASIHQSLDEAVSLLLAS